MIGSLPFAPKPRACKVCAKAFVPRTSMHTVCSHRCMARKVKQDQAEERAKIKTRKEAAKTIPVLIAETQKVFNAYIRERDRLARHNCISSGRELDWSGNAVDAGHYRSTGAASHLRFDERNCHAQTKQENRFLAGNAVDYRVGLIARIGLAEVEALEADNEPRKWTRDELRAIKATYTQKLKDLRKEREA